MSAQRRTAAKRNATGAATADGPRRPREPRQAGTKAAVSEPRQPAQPASSKRAAKPQGAGGKKAVVETKRHPLVERSERVKRLVRDTRAEMTKITWPDKDTTRNLTIVVIGVSIVLGILLGGIDYVFFKILEVMS